jgi:hypothetical protein
VVRRAPVAEVAAAFLAAGLDLQPRDRAARGLREGTWPEWTLKLHAGTMGLVLLPKVEASHEVAWPRRGWPTAGWCCTHGVASQLWPWRVDHQPSRTSAAHRRAMLLDPDDLTWVLVRPASPQLSPERPQQCEGGVANAVFPAAASPRSTMAWPTTRIGPFPSPCSLAPPRMNR